MIINGKIVRYLFGPDRDLNVWVNDPSGRSSGFPFYNIPSRSEDERCHKALGLQLICHAVHQIKIGTNAKEGNNSISRNGVWEIRMTEEVTNWESDYKIVNGRPILMSPKQVTHAMTYAQFSVFYEGELMLCLSESYDYDYIITYCRDLSEDTFCGEYEDLILDYALEHCRRFGRM